MTFETPRLTLRPMGAGDIDAIVDGIGNYDVARWLSQVPYPYTKADAEEFLSRRAADGAAYWAIDAGDGLVGAVSIDDELGYWLARPAWGQGYGFEAVHGAVTHWFKNGPKTPVKARYFLGNVRSRRVLECLGFVPAGIETHYAKALSQDVASQVVALDGGAWAARQRFELETERLRLRPLERRDARALAAITAPEVVRWLAAIQPNMTEAAAKAFIVKRRWQGLPGFFLAIEDRSGRLIGCVGCGGSPVTATIFFGPEYWGHGYGSEAGGAFVAELFTRFPIEAVRAEHYTENQSSARLLARVGFERIGERPAFDDGPGARIYTWRLTRKRVSRAA
ncbi:MAG: GNAT family N-acetyltransferase [Pseudomonadota bacterium]